MCWKSQDPPSGNPHLVSWPHLPIGDTEAPKHVRTGRTGQQDSPPCPVPGAYNFSSTSPLPRSQAGPEAPPVGLGSVARALPPAPTFLPAGPDSHGQALSWGLHDCSASLVLSLRTSSHPTAAWIEPPPPGSLPVHPAPCVRLLPHHCPCA